MSEYLAAAAQALGVPEELVMRSASARASAEGTSVDELLEAWAGGKVVEAPAAAEPAPAPVADEPAADEPEDVPPEVASTPEPAPVIAAVAVVEPEPEVVEPIEVPVLRERLRAAASVGAPAGAVLGGLLVVAGSVIVIDRATITTSDPALPAVQVAPIPTIIWFAAASLLFGAVIGALSWSVPTYGRPGMELAGRIGTASVVGGIVGAILGAVAGSLLLGVLGESVELLVDEETITEFVVPVRGAVVLIIIGGAVLGALAAMAPQLVGVPTAVQNDEETVTVRRRLTTAFGVPGMVVLTIAVLVIPFALILLQWPEYAPVTASAAALAILAFASLTRITPESRVRRGDVYAAVSGVGLILLVVVLVVSAVAGGEEEAGEEGSEPESAVVRLVG